MYIDKNLPDGVSYPTATIPCASFASIGKSLNLDIVFFRKYPCVTGSSSAFSSFVVVEISFSTWYVPIVIYSMEQEFLVVVLVAIIV